MSGPFTNPLSDRLSTLIAELRSVERALKSGPSPDVLLLQEFRQVLDNIRLTAWTVSELLNVVGIQKDPEKMLSFLAAERLRCSTQLLEDLRIDFDDQGISMQTQGLVQLFESVKLLHTQLSKVVENQRDAEIVGAHDLKTKKVLHRL